MARVYWQSLANLCRCRVATWPLSTLNPIWQTSWCVVESFYKMLVYVVTHLCTDRAIKRKESSTPELFQIANGCNQSVGSQEQGYTAAFPLVFIQRQVEEKVPNTNSVCPSRLDKSGRAQISGYLGIIARITPKFF